MPIQCQIVTQDKTLYEGPADMVVAPGTEGEMGILPNHAPVLANLDFGLLTVRHGQGEEVFAIAGGVIEVQPESITVLADIGENVAEIDEARAEEARRRAQQLLEEGPPVDTDEYLMIQAALRRSELRLKAARKFQGRPPVRIRSDRAVEEE
jgi:F-type H+-transporting ATPase subunit epsilon